MKGAPFLTLTLVTCCVRPGRQDGPGSAVIVVVTVVVTGGEVTVVVVGGA